MLQVGAANAVYMLLLVPFENRVSFSPMNVYPTPTKIGLEAGKTEVILIYTVLLTALKSQVKQWCAHMSLQ